MSDEEKPNVDGYLVLACTIGVGPIICNVAWTGLSLAAMLTYALYLEGKAD